MSPTLPLAQHEYQLGAISEALEFLKRTRNELRTLRKVHVWSDRFQVFDVNGDYFEIRGLGYEDSEIVPILLAVHTAFNPETIHSPIEGPYKEFHTGRRHPWGGDRVM